MSNQASSPDCPGSCPTPPQLQLYQTIIFATPVLFAFLLTLVFCMLYLRRRRTSNIDPHITTHFMARGIISTPHFDHGLTKSFRQRLPTVPFDEKFAAKCEDAQCAVCLGDYQINEKLQQLPVCNHSFHVHCIDQWLAKNTTCPICRTSLLQQRSRVGTADSRHAQDVNNNELSTRGEESGRWEERVVSEIHDGIARIRTDASNGPSNSGVASSETSVRYDIEHAINIERI